MSIDVSHELGQVKARLDSHEADLSEIKSDVKLLLSYADRSKGAGWTLTVVGTLAGAVGAGLAKLLAIVKGGP